jgi:hypothetical protein
MQACTYAFMLSDADLRDVSVGRAQPSRASVSYLNPSDRPGMIVHSVVVPA